MHKKILITGANGKIANKIILNLQDSTKLFLFSRNKDMLIKNFFKLSNCQCYSYDELDYINEEIDILLHCAFERSQDNKLLQESVSLSEKIFKFAKNNNCKKVIFISSQAVYNMIDSRFWTENDITETENIYGIAKRTTEQILEEYLPSNKYIIARLSALSGSLYPQHILYKFILSAIKNKKIKIIGGTQKFSFMHFKDAIDAIMILLNSDIAHHNIYNIGNNEQYGITQLAEIIKKYLPLEIEIEEKDIKLNTQMDASRFMQEFNWKPKYSIDDSIIEIINDIKNNEVY